MVTKVFLGAPLTALLGKLNKNYRLEKSYLINGVIPEDMFERLQIIIVIIVMYTLGRYN